MADEIEETLGSEPNESQPKGPIAEDVAASAADGEGTSSGTRAGAPANSSQEGVAQSGAHLSADTGEGPETPNAAIAEASTDSAPVAVAAEEPGLPAAGTQQVAAEDEDWERETIFPSASASPDGLTGVDSGTMRSKADSPAPSSNTTSSRSQSGSNTGNGARNGRSGVSGGWGADLNKPGLGLLYDVELDATLQFGSKEMLLRDVLELGPGDVVELDSHISEPVDLVVGDRIVARGEVVVASGNFALRVTEVATPQMRLESIRCLF